jgi:hypothetical protein
MRHGQGPHMCGPSGRRMRRPAQLRSRWDASPRRYCNPARRYSAVSSHQ